MRTEEDADLLMDDENPPEDIINGSVEILEELVYPYEMTHQMLEQYENPAFVVDRLDGSRQMIMMKLYRSCRYWRTPAPKWLVREVIGARK